MGDALVALGYRRSGWTGLASRRLTYDWYTGNIQSIIDYTKRYDAFEDIPWPFLYQEMAEAYPDAKFIPSTRKSEEMWLRSIAAHTRRRKWLGHQIIYGSINTSGKESEYLSRYRNHQDEVRNYFKDRADRADRLLEVTIEEMDDWKSLCAFLDIPNPPSIGFPRSNAMESWINRDPLGVCRPIEGVIAWGEKELLKWIWGDSRAAIV